MPLTQLNYMQTIYNPLGKACFDFRKEKNIWDGRNIAAIQMKLKSRIGIYTFVADSDPSFSTHSEEFIIEMFDKLDDIEDSDVEQMTLYTEYKPCVTERKHPVSLMGQFTDFPLVTKATQTIKHTGCKHWLKDRFGDFQVYHTITSYGEHEHFRGWLKTLSGAIDIALSRVSYFKMNPMAFKASVYRCQQNHTTHIEPASDNTLITCPTCKSYAVLDGFQKVAMTAFG